MRGRILLQMQNLGHAACRHRAIALSNQEFYLDRDPANMVLRAYELELGRHRIARIDLLDSDVGVRGGDE
jgi:hypothetical protein